MIELDVQLTRDRRLVVLHDRELGRTVRGSGAVRDCSLEELCRLDAGEWFDAAYSGQAVLSFEEVLELLRGRSALNVEIKSPAADWEATAVLLVDLLRDADRLDSTVVSSFDAGALRCVREQTAEARLGVLWHTLDAQIWPLADELGAFSLHPHWALIDPELVERAHRRNLRVIAWTVNATEIMRTLIAQGVDGIITDHPEFFETLAAGDRENEGVKLDSP